MTLASYLDVLNLNLPMVRATLSCSLKCSGCRSLRSLQADLGSALSRTSLMIELLSDVLGSLLVDLSFACHSCLGTVQERKEHEKRFGKWNGHYVLVTHLARA